MAALITPRPRSPLLRYQAPWWKEECPPEPEGTHRAGAGTGFLPLFKTASFLTPPLMAASLWRQRPRSSRTLDLLCAAERTRRLTGSYCYLELPAPK